jgi:hypothetical protein
MTLFSSLGWRPMRPARSSSLRLRVARKKVRKKAQEVENTRSQWGTRIRHAAGAYLHRVARKLVHDYRIFRLVKGARNMLDEETEGLPILLGGHWHRKTWPA